MFNRGPAPFPARNRNLRPHLALGAKDETRGNEVGTIFSSGSIRGLTDSQNDKTRILHTKHSKPVLSISPVADTEVTEVTAVHLVLGSDVRQGIKCNGIRRQITAG